MSIIHHTFVLMIFFFTFINLRGKNPPITGMKTFPRKLLFLFHVMTSSLQLTFQSDTCRTLLHKLKLINKVSTILKFLFLTALFPFRNFNESFYDMTSFFRVKQFVSVPAVHDPTTLGQILALDHNSWELVG